MDRKIAAAKIKQHALDLGFFACGIAEASFLSAHGPRLKKWLDEDQHGEMDYMANHFNMRLNPSKLVECARSIIVVLQNYYPEKSLPAGSDYLLSRYAYGTDYHFVIKEKLRKLQGFIQDNIGHHQSRVFTDSAPVLERAWAVKAGLGWIGKNSMLISPRNGSYFFIGEIITDLDLHYEDASGGDYCGDCTRCIDACPTSAIGDEKMIDSRKCISYLTIEKKGILPKEFKGKFDNWIFGCDICQEVCPWNRFSVPHNETAFQLVDTIRDWQAAEWENLDEDSFNHVFRKSPLKRVKFEGIKRNIEYLKDSEENS